MEASYDMRLRSTRFSLHTREYKRKNFPKVFLEMIGKAKSSYDFNKQPRLALAAQRVVFRWLSVQVNTKNLEYMPPMALEWCDSANNDCMYTSSMKNSKWSTWVFKHCPWWLDFPIHQTRKKIFYTKASY
ncbi:hypothetical protein O6H91_09G004200 [Diphasiastrum complanatum]|uniref:Uncharacterized protein n=1 Tax=Diphasiastrum complanatum TaxID=34168 RepID=A0ACC2CKZ4_DIPCM|nr:hypothetical protein O6H91_09G004200 [Diphasiastrum complanatum]